MSSSFKRKEGNAEECWRQTETCDLLSKQLELENSNSAGKELIKNRAKVLGKADFTEVMELCGGVKGLWQGWGKETKP